MYIQFGYNSLITKTIFTQINTIFDDLIKGLKLLPFQKSVFQRSLTLAETYLNLQHR